MVISKKIKHVNSGVNQQYIKLIFQIKNTIKDRCCIKMLNICRPVAMGMAKLPE